MYPYSGQLDLVEAMWDRMSTKRVSCAVVITKCLRSYWQRGGNPQRTGWVMRGVKKINKWCSLSRHMYTADTADSY